MSQFQVDSEAVLSATGAVRASISRIQSEVEAMHGQLVTLQASWSGQAATAFQYVVDDWRGTQQRVEQSLEGIAGALGQAGQGYADVEAGNAALFAR